MNAEVRIAKINLPDFPDYTIDEFGTIECVGLLFLRTNQYGKQSVVKLPKSQVKPRLVTRTNGLAHLVVSLTYMVGAERKRVQRYVPYLLPVDEDD